ncbi:uncharacterized protein (TIGR02001 family) [Halospina denitrificans]|uniref:Uncharacterized protein (TIGR02001 family) n=1 Tax=Halospina denitrificans TaxID=332522 RepID=A0A4R7JK47_9GAMM|nr:TorF family putative porin [Halospina denitrificans]TDT36999.1 uncharacterized protein (TIGR02001 family) [Halospina denitrificans]
MQTPKNRLATYVAAGIMGSTAVLAASPAVAFDPSLSAGVGISNMYLWRGVDLGTGDAMVSGSLDVDSGMGAYAGVWTSSGDSGAGQEYDLYAGYATDITDDISVDAAIINYIYPKQDKSVPQDGFSDFSEAYLGVSAYGFGVDYYKNVTGSDYQYVNASYGYGPFGIAVGKHLDEAGAPFGDDMTHLDLSFQFNDELSFTTSTIVDSDTDDSTRRTTLVQVTYSKSFDFK